MVTGSPKPHSGDPEEVRYALQSELTELLRRACRAQPLLLVADDLHWADFDTLHLLRRLARVAPETRLLVVAACRDRGEELEPALVDTLADLCRLDGVTRLALGNLSDEELSEFIRGSTGAAADPELASVIGELTEGMPLLLCELWRDLNDQGAVEVSDAGARLARPVAELHGPEHVRELVQHRLSRLARETTAMVEQAAVFGTRFEVRVLADTLETKPAALAARLEEAIRGGMVEELPTPEPSFRFTHELFRRAVCEGIPGIRRAELHLRAGEALERVHQTDPARVLPELAHHFTLAAPVAGTERATDYNLRAAEAAMADGAFREAAARLRSALTLGIADPRERALAQVRLAYILRETGRTYEAEALLAASLESEIDTEVRGHAALVLVLRLTHELWDPVPNPHGSRQSRRRRSGRSRSSATRAASPRPDGCSP